MSKDKIKDQLEASPEGTTEVERRQKFERSIENYIESKQESIEAVVEVLENFDGDVESVGSFVVESDSGLANKLEAELEEFISSFVENNDLEAIAESEKERLQKQEADIVGLQPGDTIVFNSGEYKGLTGEVMKVAVGPDYNQVSVKVHQQPYEDTTVYVEPRFLSKPNFNNVSDNEQEAPAEEI